MQLNKYTHTQTHTARPSYHAEDQSPGTGGERQDRGGGRGGGEEAKNRKKPKKSYRRDVENGEDMGGRRKKT